MPMWPLALPLSLSWAPEQQAGADILCVHHTCPQPPPSHVGLVMGSASHTEEEGAHLGFDCISEPSAG